MSFHKRLKRLEDASRRSSQSVSVEKLRALSDEDLDTLEDTLETALASGESSFEDFYAVVTERGRRALHAHYEAIEAWRRDEREAVPVDEEETEEAFRARRQLVKFLVAGITAGNRREDGSAEIRITYRFEPPGGASDESQDLLSGDYSSVGSLMNGNLS